MTARLLVCVVLFGWCFACTAKPACQSVAGTMRLTHVTADEWQADYSFNRPIDAILFGSAVADYRRTAWKLLTPEIELVTKDGQEQLQGNGRAFRHLRLRVALYKPWDADRYVPMSRHSDGGTDVYLGYFTGEAIRGARACPLQLRVQLQPMQGESVFTTGQRMRNPENYAHFGNNKPISYGAGGAIVDPQVPLWMREVLQDTIPKAQAYYTSSFKRKHNSDLLLMMGTGDLTHPGRRSIKGGALGGQLFYKIEGAKVMDDTPEARKTMQHQVFHELAHIWQALPWPHSIVRYESAWLTEGGAEALSLAGLQATALLSAADVDSYAAKLEADCDADQGHLRDKTAIFKGRAVYGCGYLRFRETGIPAPALWQKLLDQAMRTRQPYSQEMFDRVIGPIGPGHANLRTIR